MFLKAKENIEQRIAYLLRCRRFEYKWLLIYCHLLFIFFCIKYIHCLQLEFNSSLPSPMKCIWRNLCWSSGNLSRELKLLILLFFQFEIWHNFSFYDTSERRHLEAWLSSSWVGLIFPAAQHIPPLNFKDWIKDIHSSLSFDETIPAQTIIISGVNTGM